VPVRVPSSQNCILTFPALKASLVVGSSMASKCLDVSPLWERERCAKEADRSPVVPPFTSKVQGTRGVMCRA